MLPFSRIASVSMRQFSQYEIPVLLGSSLKASSSSTKILCSRRAYADQAGQPLPPTPPSPSTSSAPSSSSSSSPSSESSSMPSSFHPATVIGAGDVSESSPPAGGQFPQSSGKDIKPVSSLAAQYLDMTQIPASAAEREQERTGARSTAGKRPLSSSEKKRKNLGRALLASTTVGIALYSWHLGRDWESEKEKGRIGKSVTDEEGLNGRWQRGRARALDTLDYFNKPAWDPLLPDLLPPPHQKPYTLVLSLDDLLIHSSWDREHGWRTAKRPGVDYFLAYLSQFYEIVLFTSQPPYTAIPIVEKLDPHMIYILYKLFRDSTRYFNKDVIKDLSYLGRDLKKVVMLDTNPKHFSAQPENAIQMQPWTGNRADTGLVGMIPFLEAITYYQLADVRTVIKSYAGKHIPTAWAAVEAEQKREVMSEWEASQSSKRGRLGGNVGSWFGVSNPQVRHDAGGPPKTALEKYRDSAQANYLEEQKYWAENKEAIEKAIQEDMEKQKRERTSSIFNFLSSIVPVPPPPGASGEGTVIAAHEAASQHAQQTLQGR